MSFCCVMCFADSELKWKVSRGATRVGVCARCGSSGSAIAPCSLLENDFVLVLDAYEECDDGRHLADCLQEDWRLFRLGEEAARELVNLIVPGTSGLRYKPKSADVGAPLDSWAALRDQLTTTNRFFPEPAPDKRLMQDLTGLLVVDQTAIPESWYRARVKRREAKFTLKEMGVPPRELATGGRANPVGIPYLYLASDIQTAVAEVRPGVADIVCVAKFEMVDELKLVDLSSPRNSISPFNLDADSLHRIRACMDFVSVLGEELSEAAPPHRAPTDYLATQYLCEMIKTLGYDGVLYRSAIGPGKNVAIFYADKFVAVGRVAEHEVKEISLRLERLRGRTSA